MNFLVVLGMHRSGTSALTGMLDAIGLSTSKHLMPANQFNERGYFEDIELKQQFDNIFHSLGRSWRDERTLPTDWQNSEPARAAQSEITHTFANTYDFNQLCVMKDPRVCRLLPLVKQVLNTLNVQPIYLFSLRTPHAVIASLAHRDAIPRSRAALLYVAYLLEAERETRGLPRAFIEYNSLLSDWQGCIRKIEYDLDINLLPASTIPPEIINRVETFLSPTLNHSPTNTEATESDKPMQLALAVYNQLNQPQTSNTQQNLDNIYQEWLDYLNSIAPWLEDSANLNYFKSQLPRLLTAPTHEIINEASSNAFSVLYWPTLTGKYIEANSVRLPWLYGPEALHQFILPAMGEWKKILRWDITDRPGFCTVYQLWLENAEGEQIWAWQPGSALFGHCSEDLHVLGPAADGAIELMVTGFDPHAPLQIPAAVLAQIQEGWRVCIKWSASLPNNGTINMVNRLKRVNAAMKKAESTSTQQQKQIRIELVRAEAQLQLLKAILMDENSSESL